MPRVFISDNLEASGIDLLKQAGLDVDFRPKLKGAALQEAMQNADGMVVRGGTQVTGELLERPGKLRAVVRAGVGVDNIDVAAATRRGIVVMNTPGGNTVSTAEHTIAMMMALARHIPAAHAATLTGKADKNKYVGVQLAGKTLGIIGLGRIGVEVARRAAGLAMNVVGHDPFLTAERAAQLGIENVADLDALLPRVDFLTVHTPGGPTTDLLDARRLALLKRGARVINCARGGIINEEALAEALKSGHIAGAALDVFVTEPPPADHPLLKLPNVVVTPHLGASTLEAQDAVAQEAANLLIGFLQRGVVQFAVNMAAVDRTELDELRLYANLAWRLGLLHTQMAQGAVRRAELHYRGEVARRSTKLITSAFAAGLLQAQLAQDVNIVNAELVARERGIDIVEQLSPRKGDFGTLIRAEVCTERKSYVAAGTLFGNEYLRLVQLGPYHLDSFLDGIMLIFTHRDVPGLIGFIGTIFGKHKVNIAQMTVGRQQPGGEAIAVLNLDSPPPEDALKEVRAHPQISSLSVVQLPPAGQMPAWFG
jgi:D-3-phosphoglycerate dehydrogenase